MQPLLKNENKTHPNSLARAKKTKKQDMLWSPGSAPGCLRVHEVHEEPVRTEAEDALLGKQFRRRRRPGRGRSPVRDLVPILRNPFWPKLTNKFWSNFCLQL
jgi:hypothetical protein